MTTRVGFTSASSYLSTEFGLELAKKKTGLSGKQIEALVGRYKKGVRKGQLKGVIHWYKVTTGGWYKTGRYDFDSMSGSGFVVRYVGMCFGFGISIQQWRGPDQCVWGLAQDEEITNSLAEACKEKQMQIQQYKKDKAV